MEKEEIDIIIKTQKKILKKPKAQIEGKHPDLYQRINTFVTIKNQNLYQRFTASINIAFEFYRIIACSLLILFIPQNCGSSICGMNEKLQWYSLFYGISLFSYG